MGALKMPGFHSGKESEEEVRVKSTVDIRVLTGNSPTWYHLRTSGFTETYSYGVFRVPRRDLPYAFALGVCDIQVSFALHLVGLLRLWLRS